MLLRKKCVCGFIASGQSKRAVLDVLKDHEGLYTDEPEKHTITNAKDV